MEIKKENLKKLVILLTLGILAITLHFRYDAGIPCIFLKITGLYCPGCGITRSLFSLLQLDIYQAFRYNMLVVIIFPLAIVYWIYMFILNGKKRLPNLVWYLLLMVTILFGVLRNIPVFSFLEPTVIH